MSEESKSALDLLREVHQMVSDLSARIVAVEKTNSFLLDIINKQLVAPPPAPPKAVPALAAPPAAAPVVAPVPPPPAPESPKPQISSEGATASTRVFGKILTEQGEPRPGITITIVNAQGNSVVKTTKTNRSGEFNAFIPKGTYVALASLEGNQQKYKSFQVLAGAKELEISII